MPFDGTMLSSVVREISALEGGRVDKIAQVEKDEVHLHIRAKGGNHRLLLTANPSSPRVCLSAANKPSPPQAPMFCMVLRKHLAGGRVAAVVQPDFDRICEIHVDSADEMGDRTVKRLILETMGKHSNLILVGPAGKVIDAIKHVPPSVSRARPVLPGTVYERPPGKTDPTGLSGPSFSASLRASAEKIHQALYKRLNGISPVLAADICRKAGVDAGLYAGEVSEEGMEALFRETSAAVRREPDARIYFDAAAKAVDFAAFPLLAYRGMAFEGFASPSACLETFYSRRDSEYRIGQKTADLRRLVSSLAERARKKSFVFEKTQEEIKDKDSLRINGELILANLHAVQKGDGKLVCQNYYDGNRQLEIRLDPLLSPQENSQRYFKLYAKQKRAGEALLGQIAKNNEDIAYFEGVLECCRQELTEPEIGEIRAELAEGGYAKRKHSPKKPPKPTAPQMHALGGGFAAYVGKNNKQNDYLTLRFAKPRDIWLHAKDIPGSHVILTTGGREAPPEVLLQAAKIAAYFSKAKNGSNVPVDYVEKKHVRKPGGAKPGYVIYDSHKTLYVAPEPPPENPGQGKPRNPESPEWT